MIRESENISVSLFVIPFYLRYNSKMVYILDLGLKWKVLRSKGMDSWGLTTEIWHSSDT